MSSKQETIVSISLIIIYVMLNSFCMQNFGITDYRTTILNSILSLIIILFIIKNKLFKYYGLVKVTKYKEFLYFIPLILTIFLNFLGGIAINNTKEEIIFYFITMLCIGFLEEIIFRGFLFKMMEKDSVNAAIIVTSLTFGIGHLVNLLNGAQFIPTLIQVIYCCSVGFLFVTILQKSKSLFPCIITHALTNMFSIFAIDNIITLYISPIFLVIISISYSIYIRKNVSN